MPAILYSAFIAVFSSALVVHFYAFVGVPVSSSQAIPVQAVIPGTAFTR
ncbi:MAG: hypothetical protein JW874_01755 [Spirochaetales bacterium]|nr:hypothetical protein [Spirochaetales bacterium]